MGRTIAAVLREHGLRVVDADIAQGVPDGPFDAYVIGSAVYRWKWMKQANQFVHEQRETLLARPVWLFSSVPVGHPPRYEDAPLDVADLFWCTAPRQHQTFSGIVDATRLSLTERAIAVARRTPYGDYRDWQSIRDWAARIAAVLLKPAKQEEQQQPRPSIMRLTPAVLQESAGPTPTTHSAMLAGTSGIDTYS
jgi:menaquinone-dependent protoporphyrinogen oxidase